MARLPRYFVPDVPLHLIQRGNDRQVIFAGDEDFGYFRDCLHDAAHREGLAIHAYIFMSNHVHLLATPAAAASAGRTLQSVGRRYVQYFNQRYRRTGTLWEGRYKATVIDAEDYLFACMRYIELNPVRAGMVAHPSDYRWSSYRAHAEGEGDGLLTDHRLYRCLGMDAESSRAAYRQIFRGELTEALLTEIREATNKGWALGGERFRREIEALGSRRASPGKVGRPANEAADQLTGDLF
jgi:putative transposase